ncbi:MAG TPA: hypothetical protein VNR37_00770 [Microbacteriaceae bacterium]|nr:hypothetical protein [Microbacteriaceae bacterium]
MDEEPWYAQLREKWKPEKVRLLLIAESAPDDRGDPSRRRFFYADRLTIDNLFRSVVLALYDVTKDDLVRTEKTDLLARLKDDGVYLIDLVPYPINGLDGAARRQAQTQNVAGCVARGKELVPEGVVVIKKDIFALLDRPLRAAGLPVLHERGIPFPLGNTRAEFVDDLRDAVEKLPAR